MARWRELGGQKGADRFRDGVLPDSAATLGFAANAYKQNLIFPPPANPEASSNKNSSESRR